MIMKRKLILICGMLLMAAAGFAQRFSNKGREFWTGYGLHYSMETLENKQQMVLYLSAEDQPADVIVTTYGETASGKVSMSKTYHVPKYTVIATDYMPKLEEFDCRLYDLPPSWGGRGSDRLFDRSIHIESDKPIVAYAHISDGGSSGATMLMPVESWGYSYVSLNIDQRIISGMSAPGSHGSWLFVVANHDNTKVEITPSVPLRNGAKADEPFFVTLNKGQIYQVVAALMSPTNGYELSGTKVRVVGNSNDETFPVAVFTGSSVTAITCNGTNNGFGDNIIQQIVPIHAWGRTYLTAPFSSSDAANELNPTIYRIAVRDPKTIVKKNGQVMTGLTNGYYYQFMSSTADLIEADKPILVSQYMPSMSSDISPGCGFKGLGDPEMVYLSPVEQAINHLGFYRNTEAIISVNYLTLIIPDKGLETLKIDGSQNFSYKYPHPNKPGYTVVVQQWKPSEKAQCIVDSDSAFTSVTYGMGWFDSYAYNGGTMVNNLNGTGSIHNVEGKAGVEHPFTCTNSPMEISILMTYQPTKLVWKLSELTNMKPNADITQDNPVPVTTVMVKGVPYFKYTVPGQYQFSEKGTFRFTVTSTHPAIENYGNRENLLLDIEVRDINYTATFTNDFSGCISDPVLFKWDPNPSKGDYVINKWLWTFPDGTTGTNQEQSKKFDTNTDKDISLRVITEEGCFGTHTETVSLKFSAKMQIKASKTTLCAGEAVDFEAIADNSGTAPINAWFWRIGSITTSTLEKPTAISFKDPGTYTVKMVGKAGGESCVTDTAELTIKVNAKPFTTFTYPVDCLPADGVVNFSSTAYTSDGSRVTAHLWNFGDPSASPVDNTSSLANPSHKYKFGEYKIQYKATTEFGCSKDTSVDTKFTLKPEITFAALPGICENAAPVSVAKASVTNGVPGTGIYTGKGVTEAGIFDPAVAGPGKHNIEYKFTTTGGCVESASEEIEVWSAPTAAFDITSNACLGKDITLTDKSPATTPAINSWKWKLDDNTTITRTNAGPFTQRYTSAGTYPVSLVVTDARGCESKAVSKSAVIHPLPVPAFTVPSAICLPGKTVFTNQSTSPDNSALQYKWNMGDGAAVITTKDATYEYKAAGSYTITLEVTSSFGCVASLPKSVSDFRNVPVAKFSVQPQAACQGKDHSFSDNSTTANGSITTRKWDFADGTTATGATSIKKYATPATYQVVLTVTDAAGCTASSAPVAVTSWVQPAIDAGESLAVMKGSFVTLNATATRPETMRFAWTPDAGMTNVNTLRPGFTALNDQVYTLTATGIVGNCISTDQVSVKVLTMISPPSAFSPNADRVHDTWEIEGLSEYKNAVIQVFNRYGQLVFQSKGYPVPWNGKSAGKELPSGTYYYIITDNISTWKKMTGAVTIIR